MSIATGRISCRRRLAIAICVAIIAVTHLACESKPPEIYEIPDGYRGWVEIRAKRPACAPLPKSGDAFLFQIPPSGVLCTSSPINSGLGREEFYYIKSGMRVRLQDSAADPHPMIWAINYFANGGSGSESEGTHDRMRFFVGTERDCQAAGLDTSSR
jgi:hypothetical protein